MIRAEAEALPEGTPGYGRIVVTGIAPPPGRLSFVLRREGFATGCLGPRGWQTTEEELVAESVTPVPEAGGWAILIEPRLSRFLRPAPYLLVLPALGTELPIFWPDTIEMPVEDQDLPPPTPRQPEPPRWPEPPPPPRPAVTDLPSEPPRADPPPPPPPPEVPVWKKPLPLALLGLALLAGIGAFVLRDTLFPPAPERIERAQPTAPTPAPQPPAPPRATAWPDGTDGLSLQEVVTRAPDAPGIVAAARRRQQAGRHDDALALYEEAAARGEAAAWFELARLYDPVGFQPGRPFRTANPFEAARHYREAEQRGFAGAAAPRAALRAYLEGLANGGDMTARNMLREFWP